MMWFIEFIKKLILPLEPNIFISGIWKILFLLEICPDLLIMKPNIYLNH